MPDKRSNVNFVVRISDFGIGNMLIQRQIRNLSGAPLSLQKFLSIKSGWGSSKSHSIIISPLTVSVPEERTVKVTGEKTCRS